MYQPKHYTERDMGEITRFMKEHLFVTMICTHENKSYATQIPVLAEERDGQVYITGHVSVHTDHYEALQHNDEVLILFSGPHCYVSASWYSQRGQASTWNYMNVQVRGRARLFNSDETHAVIKQLTDTYERNQQQPELLEGMSEQYIQANLKAIAGFEIAADDIRATFKLGQNRDDESYKNIVAQLQARTDDDSKAIADELIKRRLNLF